MKKILFMDTSFRDGFQSFFGARVLTEDFLPAVEAAAHAGIDHFEAGGGARFQSPILYCGESPFDMMDKFRKAAGPKAKLQSLARGINVVALSQQPKDMIKLHADLFKKHGITHIRNFDALNDVRNLEFSGKCIKDAGLHHQVAITMMELPPGCTGAHDAEFYLSTMKKIMESGLPFDSICFKDASGTANPKKVFETVKKVRELVGAQVQLWFHTHATAGIGEVQYLSAIEAGIDGICVARKPVSGGTAQPDLLSMNHILKGSNFTLDIDVHKVMEANAVFTDCMKDYFFPPEALTISPEVIFSPMPGGALTANTMMMRDTNTLHLYPKVIEEMGRVIAKGGFGTSVTPMSQFYFQQAFLNVTQGPWKKITEGYGDTVLGYFGKTPLPAAPEIVELASEQLKKKPYTGNPIDLVPAGVPIATELLKKSNLPVTDENIFIVGAMSTPGSNKGLDFLKGNFTVSVRKGGEKAAGPQSKTEATGQYSVLVNGKKYDVVVAEGANVNIEVKHSTKDELKKVESKGGTNVFTNLPGKILSISVSKGQKVNKGDALVIIEAMKMENAIFSPQDGVVQDICVNIGDVITINNPVCILS